jgi:hypothetical protein
MSARLTDDPRRWYAEEAARIDADRHLNEVGRHEQKLEAYDTMDAALKKLNRAAADELDAAKLKAAGAIDSPPGGWTVEARSLVEQAQNEIKDPDTAREAMRDAAAAGDTLRLWAVGRTVVAKAAGSTFPQTQARWRAARDELPAYDPAMAPKLDAWDAVNASGRKASRLAEDRIIAAMKPPAPKEGDPASSAPAPASEAPVSREQAFISRVFGGSSH